MSIYATLWTLRFPRDGDATVDCEWITVQAQAVPPHIGTPSPGHGYEQGDPYGGFLPPPVAVDADGAAPHDRAVVFVTEHSLKGTERNPQEYPSPLLVLTGEEYARIPFTELYRRLCDALRGNRAPVIAELLLPEGSHKVFRQRRHLPKASVEEFDLNQPVEVVVLCVKARAVRCRLLAGERVLTLRARGLWDVVPGEIAVLRPHKQWSYAGHPYVSGEIESTCLAVARLGLTPLRLDPRGPWTPEDHSWGGDDQPIEGWARPIIARGRRLQWEMEQVLPGSDPDDFESDPIIESNERRAADDHEGAYRILMELCEADLRCLDAHAHLGLLAFDHRPEAAIRHYEVGVRIGELSLRPDFSDLLPWGYINNRPFLRCLHGLGLCLWRLKRFEEAESSFDRMLWLNPTDNQGVRFLIREVQAKKAWEDRTETR